LEKERLQTAEEEDIIFQSAYKETIRCKTSKPHGHGYLAKYPTRRQLMNDKIEEQARVSAATHQRNIELEGKIEKLEGQLANDAAERDRILEEYRQQIREEEQKAREAFQEKMREEMLSMLAQQKQASQQVINVENEYSSDDLVHYTGANWFLFVFVCRLTQKVAMIANMLVFARLEFLMLAKKTMPMHQQQLLFLHIN